MFRMDEMFETYRVVFEIYMEDKLINKQTMEAPKKMLIINFMQTVQQIGNDQRPMRIRMIVPKIIWDNFENKEKVLNNEVEFFNNAMLAWQEANNSSTNQRR